jgi:hypothetical protein
MLNCATLRAQIEHPAMLAAAMFALALRNCGLAVAARLPREVLGGGYLVMQLARRRVS